MSGAELAVAILSGLLINECCEVAPWIARNIVAYSARMRYRDQIRAEVRAEELRALINDRPGKLFKLITALGFLSSSIFYRAGAWIAAWQVIGSLDRGLFREADRCAHTLGWTVSASVLHRIYRDPRFDRLPDS